LTLLTFGCPSHDEDGCCQIPINSFLLEVKAERVLGSS